MKNLKDILYKVSIEAVRGENDIVFKELIFDSRKVKEDSVFIAIKGTVTDGHQYITKAVEKGAVAVICQELPDEIVEGVTYVKVKDSKKALALMASNFYDNPSEKLTLVGITGTNGKTTVASLLYALFTKAGYKVGLISTVVIKVGKKDFPTKLTTPDSLTINKYMAMMNQHGVAFCFMEASSHGIDQKRTAGLKFAGGIFTNITHEHLDYHKTFADYRDVKKSFFDELPPSAFALSNLDDKNGRFMLQNTKAERKFYALKSNADYRAKVLENSFHGMLLTIDGNEVWTRLIGGFNAYNLLAIYGAADLLGLSTIENLKYISKLAAVEGRFEHFISPEKKITAVVDYAHTPDALKNILQTINALRTRNEELITVVGCGGDRDAEKRPKMARLATTLSTKVILTSDNPRTEEPEKIIADMEAGVEPQHYNKTLTIIDRKQAIKTACSMAAESDIILIAGKGHETYQEIRGQRHHFDDMELVSEFLKQMKK